MSIFARTLIFVIGTALTALLIFIFLVVSFSESYINNNLNERLEALVRGQEIKIEQALENLSELGTVISNNSRLGSLALQYRQGKSEQVANQIQTILNDSMQSSGLLVKAIVSTPSHGTISTLGQLNNIEKEHELISNEKAYRYGFHKVSRTSVGKTYVHIMDPVLVAGELVAEVEVLVDITSTVESFYDDAGLGDEGSSNVYFKDYLNQWIQLKDLSVNDSLKPTRDLTTFQYDGFISSFFGKRDAFISIQKLVPTRSVAIEVNIKSSEVFDAIDSFYKQLFLMTFVVVAITVAIGLLFSRQITKPITHLNRRVARIADGHKNIKIQPYQRDPAEIKTLYYNINDMAVNLWALNENLEGKVAERTRELTELTENLEVLVADRTMEFQQANTQLLEALEDLNNAKNELVKAEKMASLGELVAGVAHEINTPLGVAVTGISQAQSQLKKLETDKNTGTLTATNFDKFITETSKLNDLMAEQLTVASNLIRNFKEVAVDQNHFDAREFLLADYLEKIFDAIKPKYKGTRVSLSYQCPDNLRIFTRPGAFSQVVSNLLINALIHGFDKEQEGHVTVKCNQIDDGIVVVITDDGKGISSENLPKIFDPFFTTKRGKGGSGLGLSIVYNIVTEALKGKITVESKIDEGTEFKIELPQKLTP